MQTNVRDSDAVSPVVGVMLMLVVTIIIAAVVSAFAGGLGQSSPKAPQISIGAEAHDGKDIIIDFNGGDQVSGSAIIVKTFIPMGTFKDMSHQVDLKNVTYLPTNEALKTDWSAKTIQTGDKIRINWADAFATSSLGGYVAPDVGEPVNIEIYDSTSGKVIVTTQTTILP
jgi:archaeal type IV pilus assembly protein PilA